MAIGLQGILNDHLVEGVLSVPSGSKHVTPFLSSLKMVDDRIKVLEGAMHNLPDTDALRNAECIQNLVQAARADDILFVLTSGGGSALLPAPVEGVSLQNKLDTIKLVANAGGTIQQLNTIRRKLSRLKGGKLALMSPSRNIISLIISDIVGNPLDLIASGPTVNDSSTFQDCLDIFKRLGVEEKLPISVLQYIQKHLANHTQPEPDFSHCNNALIGSNSVLVQKASSEALKYGYQPFIVSTELEGDATELGRKFAEFARSVISRQLQQITECCLGIASDFNASELTENLNGNVRLCLITAGETTVKVTGNGKGGRNQHMALSFLARLTQLLKERPNMLDSAEVCFVSAGTDGQDGPTDATGALVTRELLDYITKRDIDVESYLSNNASFDFFTEHLSGEYLLKTGLSGTNVMDIQILLLDISQ